MAGAARFLYGLALGLSLGIIGAKMVAAAAPGQQRRSPPGRPGQRAAGSAPR